jgi:hypothetical protein
MKTKKLSVVIKNYLQSDTFASELIQVCVAACQIFEKEPRGLFMQSPVYGNCKYNI